MPSSVMLCSVALVRTDVSEERGASIIKVTRIGKLGTTLTVTNIRRTLSISLRITSQRASLSFYKEFKKLLARCKDGACRNSKANTETC
jgi:hypothetical protein